VHFDLLHHTLSARRAPCVTCGHGDAMDAPGRIKPGTLLRTVTNVTLYRNVASLNTVTLYTLPGDMLVNFDEIILHYTVKNVPIFLTMGVRLLSQHGIMFTKFYMDIDDIEIITTYRGAKHTPLL
jgi:hypothetical protein